MKTIFALILTTLTMNAHAASGDIVLDHAFFFTKLAINPNSYAVPAGNEAGSARVDIDDENKELTLTVTYQFINNCPKGAFCSHIVGPILRPPVSLTLPLVSQSTDSCGAVTYLAKKDLRAVDGDLKQLKIVDRSGDSCLKNPAKMPVTLTLTEQPARSDKNIVSKMSGAELQ